MRGPRKTKGMGRVFVVAHRFELDTSAVRLPTAKLRILMVEKNSRAFPSGHYEMVCLEIAIVGFGDISLAGKLPYQVNLWMCPEGWQTRETSSLDRFLFKHKDNIWT